MPGRTRGEEWGEERREARWGEEEHRITLWQGTCGGGTVLSYTGIVTLCPSSETRVTSENSPDSLSSLRI